MTKDVLIAALVSAQTFAVAAESPATPAATPAAATPAEKDVKNPLKITGSFGVLGSKKKVGGVTVIALPSKEVSIESKADGTFEIEAPQGTTILTYKKDGYDLPSIHGVSFMSKPTEEKFLRSLASRNNGNFIRISAPIKETTGN